MSASTIAIIVVFLVAVFAIGYLISAIKYFGWPKTSGRIIEASIVEASFRKRYRRGYIAKVKYQYEVDDRVFVGDNIYSLSLLTKSEMAVVGSRVSVQKFVNKVENQNPLFISYDPKNPSISFLENGPVLAVVLMIVVPVGLGLLLAFVSLKKFL